MRSCPLDHRDWILSKLRMCACSIFGALIIGGGLLPAQTLHTRDGIQVGLTLQDLKQSGWVFVDREGNKRATEQVLRWGAYRGVVDQQAIWLSDGTWLCGELELSGDRVTLNSTWLESVTLPLTAVRGLVLQPGESLEKWDQMRSMMEGAAGGEDQVWLRDGNRLSGVLRVLPGQGSEGPKLTMDLSGQQLDLSQDRVQSVVFSPALLGPLEPHSAVERIALRDGCWLLAASKQVENGKVIIRTAGDLELTSLDAPNDFAVAVTYVAKIDKDVRELAALTPASYRHVPDNLLEWKLGRNRDVIDRPLLVSQDGVDQGLVESGLAMHAASQVAYRWDGTPARFQAELVFAEPEPGGHRELGSVLCRVMIAREGKLQTVAEQLLRRDAKEHPQRAIVTADISGAQLLALVVEPADQGSYGDHVLWLNAALVINP
ncbi:MAG: NPCBM/NEW2 domain-containing protein [bacterium]|nr:NPCBM/NEW2 domain-containing protein [bacterium]